MKNLEILTMYVRIEVEGCQMTELACHAQDLREI